ncbi:hypothetical protein M2275_002005 [Rhodococcus opacus]|jgi:hypothetical protein|nr:hypothetical protein [Rhodococcus opacus]
MFNDPGVRVVTAGVALPAEGEGALRPASHTATCGSPKRLSTTRCGPWGGTVAHRRVVRWFLASEAPGGGSWRSTRSCTTPHSDRPKPRAYARVTVTCRKPGGDASPCAGRGAPSRGSSGRTPGHDPTVSGWAHRADDSSHAVSEDVCTSGRLLGGPCSELSTLTAEAKVLVDQRKSRDLLAAGCVVVRLREDDLPSLSDRPSPLPGNTGALDGAASPQGHGRHPRLDAGTTNRPITRGWMDMDGGVFTYGER